jgi:hypothetical protein
MNPIEKHERKRAAQQRLRAQRMRAGMLRGRVVVISLVAFVLLWGVVFAQMATGNDPVLSSASRLAAAKRASARESSASLPAEGGAGTNAESGSTGEGASEAIETIDPEELETELSEPEPLEEEFFEEEAAPVEEELAPLTTSQS